MSNNACMLAPLTESGLCSGLIELDTPISDNTVNYWSVYERKENLQTLFTVV